MFTKAAIRAITRKNVKESCAGPILVAARDVIQDAMRDAGVTRSELAAKMGVRRSYISHMLSGNVNLTISTMVVALMACGKELRFVAVDAPGKSTGAGTYRVDVPSTFEDEL